MSKIFSIEEELAALEELKSVLASKPFSGKTRQTEILTYLVRQALAGKEPTEMSIAEDVYGLKNFASDKSSMIRDAMYGIRKSLAEYYQKEGSSNPACIVLPNGTYLPEFKPQSQPPLARRFGARLPSRPSLTGEALWAFWRRLLAAGGALSAVVLLAFLLWRVYDRPCIGSIPIIDPKTGAAVPHRYVVQAARASEQWFCNCKDYVIIEPTDQGVWWVQGRLQNGPQPSLTARFGEPDTPPGTRFSIFVLSTKADLPLGAVDRSLPAMETALQSPPVEVTLQ